MSEPAIVADSGASLSQHASELYHDPRLMPMLRQLVRTSCRLAGAVGGSVSIVDLTTGRYTKAAEFGTACRLGQTFPLHEGVTGQVMERRAPVVLGSYREIASGHLSAGHPAWDGSVAAIPIWWRGEIVAVNVIFAGVPRPFDTTEVDNLEVVTQVVAPGLVTAMHRELPAVASRRPPQAGPEPNGRASSAAAGSVRDVVMGLVDLAERAAPRNKAAAAHLQFTVVSGDRPRLLVRQEPLQLVGEVSSSVVWHELQDDVDGRVAVQPVVSGAVLGERTLSLVEGGQGGEDAVASPFSTREQEVAKLLARGLSDRAVAEELCLSPKTVEKHVSAVLRKTGTTSRTAAVVRCIEMSWL